MPEVSPDPEGWGQSGGAQELPAQGEFWDFGMHRPSEAHLV